MHRVVVTGMGVISPVGNSTESFFQNLVNGVSGIGPDFSEDQCGSTIWPDVEKFWWHSPMKYADQVKTPTLFLHSLEDYRCPVDQGYQMYSALIAHGVESRLVLFRGENHELSRSGKPKHRIRRLNEITGWFEQHKG